MSNRKNVDPEDVYVDALTHVPAEFLACREMAHTWRISSPFRMVDTEREEAQPRGGFSVYVERRLTCQRCGMIRSDAFATSTRHGHTALTKIGSSSYIQPKGYAISGIGNTQGMRDLLYGFAFEAQEAATTRRRTRKRKVA